MARKIKQNVSWQNKTSSDSLKIYGYFDTFTESDAKKIIAEFDLKGISPECFCKHLNETILPLFLESKFKGDYMPNKTDVGRLLKKVKCDIKTLSQTLIIFGKYGYELMKFFDGFSYLNKKTISNEKIEQLIDDLRRNLGDFEVDAALLRLDTKKEYDLRLMSNSEPKIDILYIKKTSEGLQYTVITPKNKKVINIITVDELKKQNERLARAFNEAEVTGNNLLNKLKPFLGNILSITTKKGHTTTKMKSHIQKQIDFYRQRIDFLAQRKPKEPVLMNEINELECALTGAQWYLKSIVTIKSPGNTSKQPLHFFLWALMDFYEEHTNQGATVNYSDYSDKYDSPFLRFVDHCMQLIKNKAQEKHDCYFTTKCFEAKDFLMPKRPAYIFTDKSLFYFNGRKIDTACIEQEKISEIIEKLGIVNNGTDDLVKELTQKQLATIATISNYPPRKNNEVYVCSLFPRTQSALAAMIKKVKRKREKFLERMTKSRK